MVATEPPFPLQTHIYQGEGYGQLTRDLKESSHIPQIHSRFIAPCFYEGFADALVRGGKRSATHR
jgi:hypothetical protein